MPPFLVTAVSLIKDSQMLTAICKDRRVVGEITEGRVVQSSKKPLLSPPTPKYSPEHTSSLTCSSLLHSLSPQFFNVSYHCIHGQEEGRSEETLHGVG